LSEVTGGAQALTYDLSTPDLIRESAENFCAVYAFHGNAAVKAFAEALLAVSAPPPAPEPEPADAAFTQSLAKPKRKPRQAKITPSAVAGSEPVTDEDPRVASILAARAKGGRDNSYRALAKRYDMTVEQVAEICAP
jgi:hypothetical protein